jgi:WD40 repeat protein
VRVLTDGNDTPWPDVWIGENIFVSGDDRGVQTLLALDGKKRTITFDLRKANDGVPVRVFSDDPFPDGVHYMVYAVDAAGDTSLFVYDSRTGDARRAAKRLTGSRMVGLAGATDQYVSAVEGEMLYANARNGTAEVHSVDVSGRDRVLHSLALPKQREEFAFAPGRVAHAYQRADTAYLDVTIGSGNSVHVLERPGAIVSDVVFKQDGSSLYASVGTGRGETARTRAGFFSTLDVPSLMLPPRWVELGHCWHPTWLPSGDGVLEFCQDSKGVRTRVERILPSGPAGQTLTQRETMPFWDYTMSPDGKYVAVPAEKSAGISLWRIDLQAAAKRQAAP